MNPLFEELATATTKRAESVYAGRGTEYGDTLRESRFLKLKACAAELGYKIENTDHLLILAIASLCDVKYWRNLGGYKDDNLIDGINYDKVLAELMQRCCDSVRTHP